MAIESNFTHENAIYPQCYIVIRRITLGPEYIETFEEIGNGDLQLKYNKVEKNIATVFVYPDAEAASKQVTPIHYFPIEFDYLSEDNREPNIYEYVYNILKKDPKFEDPKNV